VANQDGPDMAYAMFLPAHYLKKFHPAYTSKDGVDRLAQAASFKAWNELFLLRATPAQESGRSDHGGVDAGNPGERSGVHHPTQSVLHRRRQGWESAPVYRRGSVHLLRGSAGAQSGGDRRRLRYAGAAHPDDQLSGAEGTGEDRQVSRYHLADLRRFGRGDRHQHDLHG
jgi:hypothetical protein